MISSVGGDCACACASFYGKKVGQRYRDTGKQPFFFVFCFTSAK